MVESQGSKRQDTVFVLSCNKISEIYPWETIPQGIVDLEREDCHYTSMFDPIMDTAMNYSCAPREYIAGISRVTDTRIQVMCCKMRSRDEANCETTRFGKPIGFDGKVEIELGGKLINGLSIEKNLYQVRFCDLVPRDIDAILTDVRTTTTRKPTTTTTSTTTTTTVTPTTTPVATTTQPPTTIPITQEVVTASSPPAVQVPVEVNQALPVFDEPNVIAPSDDRPSDVKSAKKIPVISVENVPETATVPLSSGVDKVDNAVEEEEEDSEESVLSPQMSEIVTHRPTSVEVPPSPMPKEGVFPTDKDYENMEEAEVELMSTIAELMRVKTIAKNIINKVRSSGVKQQMKQKQQQMAEQLLREIEDENDPDRADELFKQSIEMLNELSEAKAIMSTEEFSKEVLRQSSLEDNDFLEQHPSTNAIETSTRKTAVTFANRLTSKSPSKPLYVSLTSRSGEANDDPFTSVESVSTNTPSVQPVVPSTVTRATKPTADGTTSSPVVFRPRKPAPLPWPMVSQFEKSVEDDVFEIASTPEAILEQSLPASNIPELTTPASELTSTRSYPPITNTMIPLDDDPMHRDSQSTEPPVVESEPEEDIIAAATSEDNRRAPPRHHKQESTTLPPLDNFPSPPPQTAAARHRQRVSVSELPKYEVKPKPAKRRPRPPTHILDFDEYEEAIRPSTSFTYSSRSRYASKAAEANKALASNQPYVDEETRLSPFEGSNEARVVPKTTTTPEPYYEEEVYETTTRRSSRPYRYRGRIGNDENSPFEIRRSPLPRGPSPTDSYHKVTLLRSRPTDIEEAVIDLLAEQQKQEPQTEQIVEEHVDMPDGVKTFHPKNKAPMAMPGMAKVETLVPMEENQPESTTSSTNPPTTTEVTTTTTEKVTTTPTTTTSTTTTTTEAPTTTTTEAEVETPIPVENLFPEEEPTATYDPNVFFRTPKVAKTRKPERYLTFCTKDRAIRDSNNMIVACGAEGDVWNPPRCPTGTECFYTHDSTYRICCPVSRG
uniref:ZP domain-containing protein n=1 Tax=Panagrellus redivivus TaxID=6233 RepID=A0A7E4V6A9_PANRE